MLLAALGDASFQPKSIGAIKNLSESTQIRLVKNLENYHLITLIFFELSNYPVGKMALKKALANVDKAPEFVALVLDQSARPNFQDLLILIAELITLNTEEFKLLRWILLFHGTASTYVRFKNLIFWSTFKGKSEEFFALPPDFRSTILKKLSRESFDLMLFLFLLEIHKSSRGSVSSLALKLESIDVSQLLSIASSKNPPLPKEFIEVLFKDLLEKRLKQVTNIEACLPYFNLESLYPGLFEEASLRGAWKRSNHRTSGMILNFRSEEVEVLKQHLEILRTDFTVSTIALRESSLLADSREIEISKLKSILGTYENRLRERVQGEVAGQGAVERQIGINFYRKIVEVLEPEIARTSSDSLLLMIAKLNISRVGMPGEPIVWDEKICESLTGAKIDNPIVIRPGYTWSSDGELTVLVKALVKPSSRE